MRGAALNHVYAVLDDDTVQAALAKRSLHAVLGLQTRQLRPDAGPGWTGHYLVGRETYVELFDTTAFHGAAPGITGLAVSTDRAGDLDALADHLAATGAPGMTRSQHSRMHQGREVPWFTALSPPGPPDRMAIWAMEYLPGIFDATGSPPPSFVGDVSRRRYNAAVRSRGALRDLTAVELAAPPADVRRAGAMLAAAGWRVVQTDDGVCAGDGHTVVDLRVAPAHASGLRRLVFAMSGALPRRRTHVLGRSTLVFGTDDRAIWSFDPAR